MKCSTQAWSRCRSWMLRDRSPRGVTYTPYLYIFFKSRYFKYCPSIRRRKITSLDLIIRISRIGSAFNITLVGWPKIKDSNAYWRAWRKKHQGHRIEGRERYQLDPQGEILSKNASKKPWSPAFSDGECFLAEMLRQSHRSLGIIQYGFWLESALQIGRKLHDSRTG